MLVTMKEMLEDARARKYGVGMFNTFNVEMALGVIRAAEALKAPVIIGTAEALLPCADIPLCAELLRYLAKRSSVPVVVHLDHGFTENVVRSAVDAGFTSVMYDCSEKPYEQNVESIAAMVEYAHRTGVTVEAELGHVVFNTKEDTGYAYTKPEAVVDFVSRTGVDALAVAIGTAHGVYKTKPVLDLNRLREIRAVTDVSLVLHGGSGLSDDDFRNCVRDGIQKINIYTDMSRAMTKAAHDEVEAGGLDMQDISPKMTQAAYDAAIKKLRLFGCEGKA